ncbi:MAG: dNTP triphosphohydrolase [Planctomycetes bacterium]|nr:dNTP triphosphohydrolase [Planctomycetota bacterium]
MRRNFHDTADLEREEDERLSEYAVKSSKSLGRKVAEDKHPYRTMFQRDRDRIIYSAAFRRLEEKTQVYYDLNSNDFRTRLTHTLEVAQTARIVSNVLGLNSDLAEAIACAHDIGHPPFGHQGEELLNRLVCEHAECRDKSCIGFEHNLQSLRIVDFIEDKYPDFCGLNLTFEVLRGIAKYNEHYPGEEAKYDDVFSLPKSFEALIVDKCDRISYLAHDLEDALVAGYLKIELIKNQPLVELVMQSTGFDYDKLPVCKQTYLLVRDFKNYIVTEFINECADRLECWDAKTANSHQFIDYPEKLNPLIDGFYEFLYTYFYEVKAFKDIVHENTRAIDDLFHYFLKNPQMLPPDKHNLSTTRRVCDHIASHTDRSILLLHKTQLS